MSHKRFVELIDPIAEDGLEPFTPRLRHPLECMPYRPAHRPAYSPRRDRRDAGLPRIHTPRSFIDPRLNSGPNLGAVRINFRYAGFQSVSAAHSEKAGRDQFFEGPHEAFGFRLHEINPFYVDLQYQPIRLSWKNLVGTAFAMFLDFGVETQTGAVVFGEDKATQAFFDVDDLRERHEFAEKFLKQHGASFERRVAGDVPSELKRSLVKDVYDARRTHVADGLSVRVREMIASCGGTARLEDVLRLIGEHPTHGLDIARAMMHQRIVSMPLDAPPMPDTPVRLAPQATKGALRAFLSKYLPLKSGCK